MTSSIKVLTPTGCIGNRGIIEDAFISALDREQPDVIAVDGGSLDPGPWYLGAGKAHSPLENVKRDLDLVVSEGVRRHIPVIIGTAGGSGAKPHVDQTVAFVRDIADRRNLSFRLARIYSDVSQDFLLNRIKAGEQITKIPAHAFPDEYLTEDEVLGCRHLVAMMGTEPIIAALEAGADVVLAGRASDSCVIGAFPVMHGHDKGAALHMGDIMECGESALIDRDGVGASSGPSRTPIIGKINGDSFTIKSGHSGLVCTPESVSAHSSYEQASSINAEVPGGVINRGEARYDALPEDVVRVSGTQYIERPYSVLIEGAQPVGWRSVAILGVRNPRMITEIDSILEQVRSSVLSRFGDDGHIEIFYHLYGVDGVLGTQEPVEKHQAHEIGLVIDVIGSTQTVAHEVAEDLALKIAFFRYPGRTTTAGNVAYLFSPNVIDAGEAFITSVYHELRNVDPLELFELLLDDVNGESA